MQDYSVTMLFTHIDFMHMFYCGGVEAYNEYYMWHRLFSNCMFIQDEMHKDCRIIEGHFVSPFCEHLPGIMPPETEIAQ